MFPGRTTTFLAKPRLIIDVVLESLAYLFLDTSPTHDLIDIPCQLPARDDLWQSRNESEWASLYNAAPGKHYILMTADRLCRKQLLTHRVAQETGQRRSASSGSQREGESMPESFTSKIIMLDLFLEVKRVSRQRQSSQLLQSAFASYFGSQPHPTQGSDLPAIASPSAWDTENDPSLDLSLDLLGFASHEGRSSARPGHDETLFHVLSILRRTPLKALHQATGWQANEEQKLESRAKLRDFFERSRVEARICLWHATRIFDSTRNSRLLACYDVFSLTVAMGYIHCYCELRLAGQNAGTAASHHLAQTQKRQQRRITRLDQLRDKPSVEAWIAGCDEGETIHLSGVGLLEGPDQCVRFLRAVERTLTGQIAWRGFSRAFAISFAQLRRGETPSIPKPSEGEDENQDV